MVTVIICTLLLGKPGNQNKNDLVHKRTAVYTFSDPKISTTTCPLDSWGKILRRPGIEPGSTAWKAAMLTIIPPTLC